MAQKAPHKSGKNSLEKDYSKYFEQQSSVIISQDLPIPPQSKSKKTTPKKLKFSNKEIKAKLKADYARSKTSEIADSMIAYPQSNSLKQKEDSITSELKKEILTNTELKNEEADNTYEVEEQLQTEENDDIFPFDDNPTLITIEKSRIKKDMDVQVPQVAFFAP